MRPVRIGILGAGALGSLVAYTLTRERSGQVCLLARQAIEPFIEIEGEERLAVTIEGPPDAPVDLLFVLVKSYATAEALAWAEPAIGGQTIAITLQNGLGNAELLAERVGAERVLVGATAQGATLLAPGLVRRVGDGQSKIAPWVVNGAAHERATEIAALLTAAGLPTSVTTHPHALLWGKLVVNSGINALTAILRMPNGLLLQRTGARRLMEAAAKEAAAVASGLSIRLVEDPVERVCAVAAATAENRSSMLQDLERRRPSEIEAINGAVVAYGRRLGILTPVNDMLTDLVRSLFEGL